ncbi:hypothetical protein HHK36_007928 [Tetracentron sinense]|uniref:SWIM-type domain-containing protein n=1 Tax=Tetracentron sinense TaxID=13715 RepID=A0A834ZFH7_TETSI|nr:hypothetical protein HHK36_007928 [Tetracentron sinense]
MDVTSTDNVLRMFELYQKISDIHVFLGALEIDSGDVGDNVIFDEGCDFSIDDERRVGSDNENTISVCEMVASNLRGGGQENNDVLSTRVRATKNTNATSAWIAKKLAKRLRANPTMKIDGIRSEIRETYGIETSKWKLYRARVKAKDEIEGNHGKSYNKMHVYAEVVRETNSSSLVKIEYDRLSLNVNPTFKRFFICFEAMKNRVLRKPLMKSSQKLCIKCVVGIYTIISKKKFPGLKLRNYFWVAARAYNNRVFNFAVDTMKRERKEAYEWLMEKPMHLWSRHAFDPKVRSDHVTNNMTESFNQWVGDLRGKPILILVDSIRVKLMGRIQCRYEKACSWESLVTPKIKRKMDVIKQDSRTCVFVFARGKEYEVTEGPTRFVVNFDAKSCSCRAWKIFGLPCKHSAACIARKRTNIEDYCDGYYSNETYLKAHGGIVHPLSDESTWPVGNHDQVEPPPLCRLPIRPKKNRRRELDEPTPGSQSRRSSTIKCCICKQFGHNKHTYQRGPVKSTHSSNARHQLLFGTSGGRANLEQ